MTVRVVTDSSSAIPQHLADELAIASVPLRLHLGGRTYRDGIDLAPDEFYRRIAAGETATTSSPSPGDFAVAFQRAFDDGADAILTTTVAVGFSAIHDAARLGRNEFPGRDIRLFDTNSAVSGAGLITIAAAEAAATGASLDQVVAAARRTASRIELLATLRTLKYLARSGKVPAARAMAGGAFRVRPVIRLTGTEVTREAVTVGRRGALARIAAALPRGDGILRAGVFHAAAPDDAADLQRRIRERRPEAELFVTSFSPSMGAHTGPGVTGAAWWLDS